MLTVAIQAGGRSVRMGRDKALSPLAGRPLIEHVLSRLEGLGDETLITTNSPERYAYLGVRLAVDEVPGAGALAGLRTALMASRGMRTLVVACDMPLIRRSFVRRLLTLAPESDVVVPRWERKFQPLLAVYAHTCLLAVEERLSAGEQSMISFYSRVSTHVISEAEVARLDPEGLSFFNVNTPEDLALAERLLEADEGSA